MANVFISHSSADAAWADKVYAWLKEDRHEVFLDRDKHDGLIVGDDWERRLYEQLRRADAVVCVVSRAYAESVWCAGEIGAARALGSELLPVLISPESELHKLLATTQGVDAAKDPDGARTRLLERLRVIDGGGGWGWPDGQSPYPGLRSFELGDHRVFFGRSREITSIAERLRSPERAQQAILAVIGPSGCGKSSLIRAGVLSRISGEDYWLTAPPIVPGTDPLGNLVLAIAAMVRERDIPFEVGALRKDIERDGLKAVATDLLLAAGADSKCKLLIVIDQFEELITQTGAGESAGFAATLAPALGGPVQILATLRPEFLDLVSKNTDLRKLPLRLRQITPLDSDALREVIEHPATVAGLSFEDDLVTRLIADTGTGEALPLLAFTLEQLADGVSRGGRLTHRRYDEIGGVRGALERQADAALEDACGATGMSSEQVIAKLLDLVTFDEQNRPSKRRLVLAGTSAMTPLEPFLQRRLLSAEATGTTTLITVSHEAFLVNWPPLKMQIEQHVDALRARRIVENAAHDWVASGRDTAALLQGRSLAKAIVDTGAELETVTATSQSGTDGQVAHGAPPNSRRRRRRLSTRVDLDDTARGFLEASVDAERSRSVRAKTKTMAVIATLAVIAATAVGFYFKAKTSQGRAVISEQNAIAEQLIAQSRVSLAKGVEKSSLQQLLAGRKLKTGVNDIEFYQMLVNSAGTFKIIENPHRDSGEGRIPVQSVAVSPDGRLIAAANNDHTVRLWNADSGSLAREITLTGAGSGTVWSVAFDPEGRRVAAGSDDGALQVFNAQTGDRIGNPMRSPTAVNSVSFGHDGQWVATGDGAGTVRVWNVARGETLVTIPAPIPDTMVRSVAYSPAGDVVASGGNDYQVRLWDARNGRQVAEPWPGIYPVMSMAFDSTGDRLVVGRLGGTIEVLNGHTLEPLGDPFQAFPNVVGSVAFSPDGTRIVSGGDDNTVKVWDANSHAPMGNPMRGHRGAVSSVAFSRDGMRIVSGSVDGSVREWDAVVGLSIPAEQGDAIRAVAFSPDNQTMASGGSDGTVKLWESKTAAFKRRLGEVSAPPDTSHGINSLAFNRDGSRVVTAASDGRVSVWDTASGQLIADLRKDDPPGGPPILNAKMQSVAYDKKNDRIAAAGLDGLIRLWNAETLTPIATVPAQKKIGPGKFLPYQVWSVAFSPDGEHIVTGSGFDTAKEPNYLIQVWKTDSLTAEGEPIVGPKGANIYSVGFDSDDQRVIAGSSDGTVRVWNVADHTEVATPLSGDQNPVFSVAVAHHNQWVATGGGGGLVRVWDLENKPPAGTPLDGHRNWVHSVAFSPDDTVILSGSADGNLQLWPAPSDVGQTICSKLTTNMSHNEWNEWIGATIPYATLCPGLEPAPDM